MAVASLRYFLYEIFLLQHIDTSKDSRVSIDEPIRSSHMCSGNRSMCSFRRHTLSLINNEYGDDSMYVKVSNRSKFSSAFFQKSQL